MFEPNENKNEFFSDNGTKPFGGQPEQEKKKKNKGLIIIIILLLLIIIGGGAFGAYYLSHQGDGGSVTPSHTSSTTVDSDVEYGDIEQMSQEEIQEMLNKKVEEGMINISMNTYPVFENGTAKGNLMIVNEKINRYPQVVQIYLREYDGEEEGLIYQSGQIPVGARIEYAALNTPLEKGTYDCVAYFNNVNEETGEFLGKAGAQIQITVQN